MSHPVSIKEVIEILCHLFSSYGFTKISPEIFRQAKFNKPDGSIHLLTLIKELLQFSSSLKEFKESTNISLIYILHKLDYPRLSTVLCFEENELPSIELLLIFGFLLHKFDLISRLREHTLCLVPNEILSIFKKQIKVPTKRLEMFALDDIIVLRTKIDFAVRGLMMSINHYEKLLKKLSNSRHDVVLADLNKTDSKIKFGQLTVLDCLFYGNLNLQKEMINLLTHQNMMLKLHYKWLKYEATFWKWMTSVVIHGNPCRYNGEVSYLHKLRTNFLVLSPKMFNAIVSHYGDVQSENSQEHSPNMESVISVIKKLMLKPVFFEERETERSDGSVKKTSVTTDIENRIRTLKEKNKVWLSEVLNEHFPDLVALPNPRR